MGSLHSMRVLVGWFGKKQTNDDEGEIEVRARYRDKRSSPGGARLVVVVSGGGKR